MDQSSWILLIAFWLLLLGTAVSSRGIAIFRRDPEDWIIDSAGLLIQGTVIPLAQIYIVAALLQWISPDSAGIVVMSPVLSFFLCFVGVDYLYYWNHRALHTKYLWNIHVVHHTAQKMDVITTSRNTVWSSFFIVYLF